MAPIQTLQEAAREVKRCERMLREAATLREERWASAQLTAARGTFNELLYN